MSSAIGQTAARPAVTCAPPALPAAKRCVKCGETKPLTAFTRRKLSPDGRQYQCRECRVVEKPPATFEEAYRAAVKRAGGHAVTPWQLFWRNPVPGGWIHYSAHRNGQMRSQRVPTY
jgi:hypothetical protein